MNYLARDRYRRRIREELNNLRSDQRKDYIRAFIDVNITEIIAILCNEDCNYPGQCCLYQYKATTF